MAEQQGVNADSLFIPEQEKKAKLNEVQVAKLIDIVQKRFTAASNARQMHEERMIDAYNNFRGLYGKDIRFRETEKSRIFVKITKTKVLAAYGQTIDIVLSGERFPIGVQATEVPEGVDDIVHIGTEPKPSLQEEPEGSSIIPLDVGFAGDGQEVPAGTAYGSTFWKKLLPGKTQPIQEGAPLDPSIPVIRPADEAAYKMDKLIQDQLGESKAPAELARSLYECVMLGTGVLKGPFTYTKTLHKWVMENGKRVYKPINTKVPRIEFASVWDIYPDPNATMKSEMEWLIHRHRFNTSQMRGLVRRPLFDEKELTECIEKGPHYNKQSFEDRVQASSEESTGREYEDRFEVLEYWGVMGVKEAREQGLDVGGKKDLDEIQINAWICNGHLIRLVQNPFTPARIPYHIFNYETNPYSIFGIGIAENMSDSQAMMNGHARMAIDNLALAGGLVFDIDETALVPGQDTSIYNGKIFWRQAGSVGQAVHGIKFPNTAQENLMMFDKFRQIADEETGIPSFSHGALGVTGMTRTAAGMSMLMGAASVAIKTFIENLDQQLFTGLGEDLFQWNMQFFEGDLDIEGDLEVKALGTNSMLQKEVLSQRLTMVLQLAQNPAIAPWIKVPYFIEELAKSLDLDKDKALNSTEEARAIAGIIGLQSNAIGQQAGQTPTGGGQQPNVAGAGGVPPAGGAAGPQGTGGGEIGVGGVPQAGEPQFTG